MATRPLDVQSTKLKLPYQLSDSDIGVRLRPPCLSELDAACPSRALSQGSEQTLSSAAIMEAPLPPSAHDRNAVSSAQARASDSSAALLARSSTTLHRHESMSEYFTQQKAESQ